MTMQLLTRETAVLLVGGFVVGIFSVIIGGGFFISIPLLQFTGAGRLSAGKSSRGGFLSRTSLNA